jgi:hypothetical protein
MTIISIFDCITPILLGGCDVGATLATNEGGASAALRIHELLMSLRAGVPVAVIAEIGSRLRIVGTVGLHAVGDRIVAAGRRGNRNRAVIIGLVVVIAGRVIARAAIIAL